MAPHQFIPLLLAAFLLVLTWLAWRTRRRQGIFDADPIRDHVFRCATEDCRYVYTDDADVESSRCPQCGRMNERVTF